MSLKVLLCEEWRPKGERELDGYRVERIWMRTK